MLVSKESGEHEVADKVGGYAKEVSDGLEGAVVIPEVPVFPRLTSLGRRMIFQSALLVRRRVAVWGLPALLHRSRLTVVTLLIV